MGFFDKVKKAFGSKNEDVESQNIDENIASSIIIDKSELIEGLNDNEGIQSNYSEETPANEDVSDKQTPTNQIRNFKYLDELIHGGAKEIVLDSDIVLGDGEESEYEDGIKLDVYNFIIDGNGYVINAKGKTRIFYCTGNVIIKNIILKNGYSDYGGAIYNKEGKITITESKLNENTAGNGGAICNSGERINTVLGNIIYGELTITGSTLTGNNAHMSGGAIYNKEGKITITGSTLTESTAEWSGGAIHNRDGELTITGSTLTESTAGAGGVIQNQGECSIANSMLRNNTAKEAGGAILSLKGVSSVTDSTFENNSAEETGGAIDIHEGSIFKIFNCEFLKNTSPNNIIINYDSLQIYNTNFTHNESKYIISNENIMDIANLSILNGEFKENFVEESVIHNAGKFCSIEKTIFENNISNNTMNIINESELVLISPKIKDKKRSILNQKYILIRKSSPRLEDTISGEGTVEKLWDNIHQKDKFDFGYLDKKIHESKTKEIILDHDITFENYERDFYEGGIELDIDDLVIDGNGHTIDGEDKSRIFIIMGKNIILKNIIFKKGHSHKNYDNPINSNGGAIKINHNSNLIIESCKFINNTSECSGGAILNKCECTIIDSILVKNTALGKNSALGNSGLGGAIISRGDLTIISSTLTENTAQWDGGAIHNKNGKLTITGSTLTGNTAEYSGGTIHNMDGELTITGSTLTENTAKAAGGAIYNWQGELTIIGSKLTGNKGGAIYNLLEKSFNIKNCKLENNKPNDIG